MIKKQWIIVLTEILKLYTVTNVFKSKITWCVHGTGQWKNLTGGKVPDFSLKFELALFTNSASVYLIFLSVRDSSSSLSSSLLLQVA